MPFEPKVYKNLLSSFPKHNQISTAGHTKGGETPTQGSYLANKRSFNIAEETNWSLKYK